MLRLDPHLFRRWILLGICERPALHKPQDRGCEVLERIQQNWTWDRATHSLGWPFPARIQRDLSVWADVQDTKLKLKVGERARNSMEGEQRQRLHRTQHMHIFLHPRHPVGEGRGEESAEQLQPLLSAAYLRSHTRSRGERGAKC